MNILGLSINRTKSLQAVNTGVGWFPWVRETFAGAWQLWDRRDDLRTDNILTYAAVYACIDLITSDIGKIRALLVSQDSDDIWTETDSAAFSPVLRKPNEYQTWQQFAEQWLMAKLISGNTYVLKARDNRGVVIAMYVLDSCRVQPLVSDSGDVFYQLNRDYLSGLFTDTVTVPAREIMHDRMFCPYHPLVGVTPLSACGLAAVQGLKIQNNSTTFFASGSRPGGVLTAPGFIKDETALRVKAYWDTNFSGDNAGKVAVLGDGMKYEPMTMSAVDSQLIEQLKWSVETVCMAFHVPQFMIGGPVPSNTDSAIAEQQYYKQCLHRHIKAMETLLIQGMALPDPYGIVLDLDELMRLDQPTKIKTAVDGIKGGIYAPNEGRKTFNLKPLAGGDTVYLQEQDHAIEWLFRRDQIPPTAPTPAALPPAPVPDPNVDAAVKEAQDVAELKIKALAYLGLDVERAA